MKILVTGASGHIGAALLKRLAPDNEAEGTDIAKSPFRWINKSSKITTIAVASRTISGSIAAPKGYL